MRTSGLKRIPKYAILILYAVFSLLPFVWMLSASLKSVEEVLKIPIRLDPLHAFTGTIIVRRCSSPVLARSACGITC